MSTIAAEDAFAILAEWSATGTAIEVRMSQGPRAASAAVLNRLLPHSHKALLTLRDENGEEVAVTVSLAGAAWEREDAGAALVATFANGHRYVFDRATG